MSPKLQNEQGQAPSIEELARTLAELRSAIKASNPLLRAVASSRLYPILSLVLGTASVIFCLAARAVGQPPSGQGLGIWAWIFLAFVFVAGAAGKVIITAKLAAQHGGRNFYSLLTAIYGGKTSTLLASSAAAMISGMVFLISIAHPWYIVPMIAIYTALASHAFDLLIDLSEYRILGWVAMAAGIVSLFFIETDPLLWTAIVTTAVFVVFGITGLIQASARGKGGR